MVINLKVEFIVAKYIRVKGQAPQYSR